MPAPIKASKKPPVTLVDALERFAFGKDTLDPRSPDYTGFHLWFEERIEHLQSTNIPLHHLASQTHRRNILSELTHIFPQYGLSFVDGEITTSIVAPALKRNTRGTKLKSLNKLKLLLSIARDLHSRGRDVLDVLSKGSNISPITISSIAKVSQIQLRIALLRAIESKDERAALRLLGTLREEAHDKGEIVYLEALVLFHANDFSSAIASARQVSAEAIDGPRARLLILESLAYLGDLATIVEELADRRNDRLPDFFLRYLYQVAFANGASPSVDLTPTTDFLASDKSAQPKSSSFFAVFNRYSCQLAIEFLEQQHERQLRDAAEAQSRSPRAEVQPLTMREEQLATALLFDSDLVARLRAAPTGDVCSIILHRLLNIYEPNSIDYFIAFMAQWRLGERLDFLDNVILNIDQLFLGSQDRWRVLHLAYQEAVARGRENDVIKLESALANSPDFAKNVASARKAASSDRIERRLSPMGRLAFRTATNDLEAAQAVPHRWFDAGMISLGFFRILELEMNVRLILQMHKAIDINDLEAQYEIFISIPNQSHNITKVRDFWQRMMPSLRKAIGDDRVGMELGTLEQILGKTRAIGGPDATLREIINKGICAGLTADGQKAFTSGELQNLINSTIREKFRNPPAHTRFLDIDTALECQVYVEMALNRLDEWTTADL